MSEQRRLTVWLDPEHIERLTEIAEQRDRSMSYLVRVAVADYLDNLGFTVSVSRSKNTRKALRKYAQEAPK